MIFLKRIYDPATEADGKRILVDRLWPRGMNKEKAAIDEWMKDIAPSDELRKWFSHDPDKWQEFRKKYQAELRARNKLQMVIHLRKMSDEAAITLLFSAKDSAHNNAVVLKDVIEGAARKQKP